MYCLHMRVRVSFLYVAKSLSRLECGAWLVAEIRFYAWHEDRLWCKEITVRALLVRKGVREPRCMCRGPKFHVVRFASLRILPVPSSCTGPVAYHLVGMAGAHFMMLLCQTEKLSIN